MFSLKEFTDDSAMIFNCDEYSTDSYSNTLKTEIINTNIE